jgi:hypothetical protein
MKRWDTFSRLRLVGTEKYGTHLFTNSPHKSKKVPKALKTWRFSHLWRRLSRHWCTHPMHVLLSVTINKKLVMHKFITKFTYKSKTRKIWRFFTCDVVCHITGALTLCMWCINRRVLLSVTINEKLVMHKHT